MATSDAPLNVPNVTLAVARGAATPPSEPGAAPSISSFSGTFAQGNTITLSGSFSAERNGQVAYITGDPAKAGSNEEQIVGLAGETAGAGYAHDTTRSFGKSGASLLADFSGTGSQGGIARQAIRLAQRSKALFFSAEIYSDLSSWDGADVGPQVKFMRLLSVEGSHNGDAELTMQLSSADSRQNPFFRMDAWGGTAATRFYDPVYGSDWARNSVRDEADRKWNRHIVYGRLPDPIAGSNGQRFARIIDHTENRQIPTQQEYTDPSLSESEYSWLAPAAIPWHDQVAAENFTQTEFLNAALPFYHLGIPQLKVWADCIYVNDTPERVEFGDAPVMDDCTKLVVQEQLSRTTTDISVQVEEANFSASDNVYAFVVNDDTQYTSGILIRSGV